MLYWKSYRLLGCAITLSLFTACGAPEETEPGTQDNFPQNLDSGSSSQGAFSSVGNNTQQSSSFSSVSQGAPNSDSSTLIHGTVTYERVPFSDRSYMGLNYSAAKARPARGVVVELVNGHGSVIAQTVTDYLGYYSAYVPQNSDVQVRVLAELFNDSSSHWQVKVRDNTSGKAQYRLDGSYANAGAGQQTRDLHAASGWDGYGYNQTRSAGPFAILDSVYDALTSLDAARSGLVYPSLSIYWSEKNISISGDSSRGYIGTSFYSGGEPAIYVLGAADNDSDEYDRAVVQHEFGHYIEHQIGRTESLGGSHSQNIPLDMRVAFGEAWGNAFAGMVSGDSLYRDSYGGDQSLSFGFDVEKSSFGSPGWYNESTVQALLYDFFDAANESNDSVALGLAPIMQVLTSDEYQSFSGYASIYPFVDILKKQQPGNAAGIDTLMQNAQIYGTGGFGDGETNDAGASIVLPVYHRMSVGDTVNVCSDSDFNEYNGLDIRRFVRINLPSSARYTISAVKTNGLFYSNPQIRISNQGRTFAHLKGGQNNVESDDVYLNAGDYVLEVYEQANIDGDDSNNGLVCFDVSVR